MEKSFSRDFSTNKNSWQLPLTSIINCYSPGHGKPALLITEGDAVEELKGS